jgi:hypothetical protein
LGVEVGVVIVVAEEEDGNKADTGIRYEESVMKSKLTR